MTDRVTLLVGGDTVYVFVAGDPNIADMEMVLDVAYPWSDRERRTIPFEVWDKLRDEVIAVGAQIVDTRGVRALRCPVCKELPAAMTDEQCFCGNEECEVLSWNPADDPATFMARTKTIDLSGSKEDPRP